MFFHFFGFKVRISSLQWLSSCFWSLLAQWHTSYTRHLMMNPEMCHGIIYDRWKWNTSKWLLFHGFKKISGNTSDVDFQLLESVMQANSSWACPIHLPGSRKLFWTCWDHFRSPWLYNSWDARRKTHRTTTRNYKAIWCGGMGEPIFQDSESRNMPKKKTQGFKQNVTREITWYYCWWNTNSYGKYTILYRVLHKSGG